MTPKCQKLYLVIKLKEIFDSRADETRFISIDRVKITTLTFKILFPFVSL